MRKLLLYFFLSSLGQTLYAQRASIRSFNISNGLPSNHVYNTIVDHHGYLWMSTPNGVVKYNGYTFKVFNAEDGLPKEDIWYLLEDKRGRIWLGCVSEEMGYIYNDKYYGVSLNGTHNVFYPHGMASFDSGIAFTSSYVNKDWTTFFYTIKDTQFGKLTVPDSIFGKVRDISKINADDHTIHWAVFATIQKDSLILVFLSNRLYTLKFRNKMLTSVKSIPVPDTSINEAFISSSSRILFDNYVVVEPTLLQSRLYTVNRTTGKTGSINIHDYGINERILYVHNTINDSLLYVFTKHYLLEFIIKDEVKLFSKRLLADVFNDTLIKGDELISVRTDNLWDNVYTTKNNGLILRSKYNTFFKKLQSIDLKGYTSVGKIGDSVSFWWNNSSRTLAEVQSNTDKKPFLLNLDSIPQINRIISIGSDSLLVLSGKQSFFLTNNIRKFHRLRSRYKLSMGTLNAMRLQTGELIMVSNYGFQLLDQKMDEIVLNNNRFTDIMFDARHNEYWAYNNSDIVIYNNTNKNLREYDRNHLKKLNINKIENIIIDTFYDNIFLQDNLNLFVVGKQYVPMKQLHNINIKGCSTAIYKRKLFITGKIGIIYIPIIGKDTFGAPRIFPNIDQYTDLYDQSIYNDQILLSTDRGFYNINISDLALSSSYPLNSITRNYRFVYKYKQNTFDDRKDTLTLEQNELKLQFDIINPYGKGQIKFTTQLDTVISKLTSSELNLPMLAPDRYYVLKVTANDDVWKSDEHTIVLYVKPYWYQTYAMKRALWIGGISVFVLLLASSVLITRRLVTRSNQKRNEQMELELKSIYAQINPHFIFNSLNSALLLVSKGKVEEAYTHISKFSKLLRSYIKSSRNKFIVLNDEINNLKNYIDLQQIRFKDKFNYNIEIADGVDADNLFIPSLLLQPFVENAIEHGLLNKSTKGNLLISFRKENATKLLCIIDDDGIGRKESKLNKIPNPTKDESYGEILIKDLVSIFNRFENMNIHVSYIDKKPPQTGTTVTIEIKSQKNAQN